MVAESNLSFNQIAQTKFIKASLAAKYSNQMIPKSSNGISAMMMKFFIIAEEETKLKIQRLKSDGKKFSATLDEWTSSANFRYLNINIHYTESNDGATSYINLGLIKINGKCPADVMVCLVSEDLI